MKKLNDINLTVEVEYDRGEEKLSVPDAFVLAYDDKGCKIAAAPVQTGCAVLILPRETGGQNIRIFHASTDLGLTDKASVARLQRYKAVEKRYYVDPNATDLLYTLPKLDLTQWMKACCRVNGKVSMGIRMPNGKERYAPLCNARLQIFEVDHSFPMIIKALPDHLVYRLRDEWRVAIENPVAQIDNRPEIIAIGEGLRQALAPKDAQKSIKAQVELRRQVEPIFTLKTATQLRRAFINNLVLIFPYICYFDWLPFHDLDLLKTIDINEDGTFDTHIYYPCFGDKPDLYFKVQQDCHEGGWLTVYVPSIHCNTYWNYSCGTKINIQVSHPKAAPGLSIPECDFKRGDSNDLAVMGRSDKLPYDTPIAVANAALLHTGEVIFLPGSDVAISTVWNPHDEEFADFHTPSPDVTEKHYCSGLTFLSDGRLLVIGGGGNSPSNAIRSSWVFDPHTKEWARVKDMHHKRWYPTAVTLQDGRVLAASGRDCTGDTCKNIDVIEVYNPDDNEWHEISGANYTHFDGTYPGLHLLPSGHVLFTRTGWGAHSGEKSAMLQITGIEEGHWENEYAMQHPDRHSGMSVILLRHHEFTTPGDNEGDAVPIDPPISYAQILVIGGGGGDKFPASGDDPCPNGKMVEALDLPPSSGDPAWKEVFHLNHKRCDVNAVLLPDGTVLACGGVETNVNSEIYDPEKDLWTPVAPLKFRRKYHSIALLLPSGKVLVTGARGFDSYRNSMELYSPPYLFRGPRPSYTIPDHNLHHDERFSIESPDACRIKKIGFMRPPAVTHQTDTEQRYVPVEFERHGKCEIIIRAPLDGATAPPGYYMLFIVDDCGIPSEAQFVLLH